MSGRPKGGGPFSGAGSRRAQHGTNSGYQTHINAGTKPCEECGRARRAYMRNRRNKTALKCAPGLGWPLEARR